MSKFEAVTQDFTVESIEQVKVRETPAMTSTERATLEKFKVKLPEEKMHRLELIDKDVADLQAQVDALMAKITDLQEVRGKVLEAAQKVKLKSD